MSFGVRRTWIALAILAALGCTGCGNRAEQVAGSGDASTGSSRPNILLIEVCSLRYDHLGCAGYDRPASPTIDALAKRGTLFTRCISASSWTKPSTASILTGLTPTVHRLTDGATGDEIRSEGFKPRRVLSDSVQTLAEDLNGAGYETAGFVANVNAWPVFGVDQGFEHYDYEEPHDGKSLVQRAHKWLDRRDPDRPFFAFVLLYDAHLWYSPPYSYYRQLTRDEPPLGELAYKKHARALNRIFHPERRPGLPGRGPKDPTQVTAERLRQWIDLYDGGVRLVDDCIGELLEYLESRALLEDTAVVVVSDHGDLHMERGFTGHGSSLCQELIHVPLIVALPHHGERAVVEDVVSTLDILPTICDYLDIELNHPVEGRTLLPYLLDPDHRADGEQYAFAAQAGEGGSVQDRRWKLVRDRDGAEELFDLQRGEAEPIANGPPEVVASLRAELDRVIAQGKKLRSLVGRPGLRELDEDALRELEALGYL